MAGTPGSRKQDLILRIRMILLHRSKVTAHEVCNATDLFPWMTTKDLQTLYTEIRKDAVEKGEIVNGKFV